jgi:hypothetical protein
MSKLTKYIFNGSHTRATTPGCRPSNTWGDAGRPASLHPSSEGAAHADGERKLPWMERRTSGRGSQPDRMSHTDASRNRSLCGFGPAAARSGPQRWRRLLPALRDNGEYVDPGSGQEGRTAENRWARRARLAGTPQAKELTTGVKEPAAIEQLQTQNPRA